MILIGGENLIDFIQIESGSGNPVYQASPGGSPYNCAKALGLQQVPVSYLTPVSTDRLGDLLADGLRESGVALVGDRSPEPSTLAVVSLQRGVASYRFYRQGTAERQVTLERLNAQVPAATAAFHIGSLALTDGADAETWTDFHVGMHRRGIFTALDPNIRASLITDRPAYMARFERLLAATDLLKLSDDDLEWLVPGAAPDVAARDLLARMGGGMVVVTLGAQGAFALAGGQMVRIDAAPVRNMRDTVGAGDTFMATLLGGLHAGGQLEARALGDLTPDQVRHMLNRAARAAALNCERSGCNPPHLDELQSTMRGNL